MPDDNKPLPPRPRAEVFPPPLPGALTEPFAKADDLPPTRRDRVNSTPPSGSLMLSQLVQNLSEDPKDVLIRELKQTNALAMNRITELTRNATPSPVPSAPVSLRTMTKREIASLGGKWTLLFSLLALALPIAAKKWPLYADIIEFVRSYLP